MPKMPELPRLLVVDAIRAALKEDLGRAGDITSAATIPPDVTAEAAIVARKPGVLAGIALADCAVRCGGGVNHRFGLDDAILIKDNHIAVVGGVAEAVRTARAHAGHLVKIEVEVDTLEQLAEAIEAGPDVVLLDNMPPDQLRKAV